MIRIPQFGHFAIALGVIAVVATSCGRAPIGDASPDSTPSNSPTDAVPTASPSSAPSISPEPTYAAADLAQIMPSEAQIAGFQTATNPNLTGPYTPTSNTYSWEEPPIQTRGFVAGWRMTFGSLDQPGLNVFRVSAEAFASSDNAQAALNQYIAAFTTLGFSSPASTGTLPTTAWGHVATNVVFAAPFAQPTTTTVYVFIWRIGNLVVNVRAGGDKSVTASQALHWAYLVYSNIPPR